MHKLSQPRGRGVPGNFQFASVPKMRHPRSAFDLSEVHSTTFEVGYLVPFYNREVLPGDTWNINASVFARLSSSALKTPMMTNMKLTIFWFFCPNRLVFDPWERLMGARIPDPDSSVSFVVPRSTSPATTGYTEMSLQDFFRFPTKVPGYTHNTLILRMYNLTWNEFFRDQTKQDSVVVDTDEGPDDPADYTLLLRGKRFDYFTSLQPTPQKGTAVSLPLGSTAPVYGTGKNLGLWDGATSYGLAAASAGAALHAYTQNYNQTVGSSAGSTENANNSLGVVVSGTSGLYADLSLAVSAPLSLFRQSAAIQQMYEIDNRSGTRYIELLDAYYGVSNGDARLQRPEFLGMSSTMINVSPVAQTSATSMTSPQGNLTGVGTAYSERNGVIKSFTEHGFIYGLACVDYDLLYQQGLMREQNRTDRFSYHFPPMEGIGDQAVLVSEIYCQANSDDDDPFGYGERYGEYKTGFSAVTGLFRSNATGSLESWHLAQDYGNLPVLNDEFIPVDPNIIDRVLAVNTEPAILADFSIHANVVRPMKTYSIPGLTRI